MNQSNSTANTSENYFKNLVDSSPAMIWMTDINSQCTYLSKQWYEYTGRTPEQDLGTGWLENIHPDDLANTSRVYTQAVQNKGPLEVDYRLRKKDGQYRWAVDVGYPRFDSQGQFAGYIGTVTDIHDRIAAENELGLAKIRFDRSAAATDLGIWYCDLPFSDLNWNKEVKNHFFLKPDAHVDIHLFYERIHPMDREMTRSAIQYSMDHRAPYDIIYRTTHPEDPSRTKSIRAIGWTDYNQEGTPVRFDGITLDVTQEVKTQEELSLSKELAEKANLAKSAFLANMSHEIRTPLGAIMGFADLARSPGLSREDILSHLEVIERNSAQVLRIIDDILDLAKVEADKIILESIEFSFSSFLADFSSYAGFKAREKGIGFVIEPHTELPDMICGDPTRLRQILTNAISNAIKFTTKGKVTLHLSFKNDVFEFGIEDTGVGISKEQAENLFQVFVQADPSTTRKFGGTGLGLVLTKKLCQLMNGDYKLVRSELGIGSLFLATMKVITPAQPTQSGVGGSLNHSASQNAGRPLELKLKGRSILLVEDSPDNQYLISRILEIHGAKVDVADDGIQGVEKALNNNYDLVIMDIQMPHMDGHQATKKLREMGYTQPIVALTAHAMKEEAERAMESGFTEFLTKPVQRDLVISTVQKLTSK